MTEGPVTRPPKLGRPGAVRRRAVSVSSVDMVEMAPLSEDRDLPRVVTPRMNEVDLATWAEENRSRIESEMARHGGLLFRGFGLRGPADLETLIRAISSEALEYKERSSPRSAVEGNIYTSTDYPPEYPIFLHNENSYQKSWPQKIFFLCHTAASEGGETPIADCRKVYQRIDPEIRRRFAERGWMYVRNFGEGFGLAWETVFQTTDRREVDEYCRKAGIETEWRENGRLRTRAVRPATALHPVTGEPIWFNHATFFHVSTLEPSVREVLLADFCEADLPVNSYYGDGSPIELEVLDHLRDAYARETVRFPWQEGDLMALDNMMVAHGRSSYSGPRKVLVGMAEPTGWDRVRTA